MASQCSLEGCLARSEFRSEERQKVVLEEIRVNFIFKSQVQSLFYLSDEVHLDFISEILWHITQVFLILFRQDNVFKAVTMGCHNFLLDAADWHHETL